MARPDKLPRVLTEEETDRLLAQPNQRYFGPHRDYWTVTGDFVIFEEFVPSSHLLFLAP